MTLKRMDSTVGAVMMEGCLCTQPGVGEEVMGGFLEGQLPVWEDPTVWGP